MMFHVTLCRNENTLSLQILVAFFKLSSATFAILQICRVNFSTTFYIALFVSVWTEVPCGIGNNHRNEQRNETVKSLCTQMAASQSTSDLEREEGEQETKAGSDVRDRRNTNSRLWVQEENGRPFRLPQNTRADSKQNTTRVNLRGKISMSIVWRFRIDSIGWKHLTTRIRKLFYSNVNEFKDISLVTE